MLKLEFGLSLKVFDFDGWAPAFDRENYDFIDLKDVSIQFT